MTSSNISEARFWVFACLATLHFIQVVHAITDPRALITTTKPPSHRESKLPWYLADGSNTENGINPSARSPFENEELQHPVKNIFNGPNARKHSFVKSVRSEGRISSSKPWKTSFSTKSSNHTSTQMFHSNANFATQNTYNGNKNNLYEGAIINSKKPTLVIDSKAFGTSQKETVAKYDKQSSTVECPSPQATGQFVYPPDCKFFVNCHQGRAFVQSCAPGTLFNPDTLECDFPYKVKCYGGENAGYSNQQTFHSNSQRISHQNIKTAPVSNQAKNLGLSEQKPECPADHTGLLPHPHTCKKFLQCVNGNTYIMDCGPGTAFNPKISVCDWPYNVPGCSDDTPKQDSKTIVVPPYHGHEPDKPIITHNNNGNVHYKEQGAYNQSQYGYDQSGSQYGQNQNGGSHSRQGHSGSHHRQNQSTGSHYGQDQSGSQYGQGQSSGSQYGHGQGQSSSSHYGHEQDQSGSQHRQGHSTGSHYGQDQSGSQYGQGQSSGSQSWQGQSSGSQYGHGQGQSSSSHYGHEQDQNGSQHRQGHSIGSYYGQGHSGSQYGQGQSSGSHYGHGQSQSSSSQYGHEQDQSGNHYGKGQNNGGISWQAQSSGSQYGHGQTQSSSSQYGHGQDQSGNHYGKGQNNGGISWQAQSSGSQYGHGQGQSENHYGQDQNSGDQSWQSQSETHDVEDQSNNWHPPSGWSSGTSESPDHYGGMNGSGDNVGIYQEPARTTEEDAQDSIHLSDKHHGGHHRHHHRHGHNYEHHPHYPHGHDDHHGDERWREEGGTRTDRPDSQSGTNDRGGYGRTITESTSDRNENIDEYYDEVGSSDNEEGITRPGQPESTDSQYGDFAPNIWTGQSGSEYDNQGPLSTSTNSARDEPNQGPKSNSRDEKLDDWLSKTNVIQRGDKRREQDTKMDDWSSKTNIFNAQQGNKRQGVKTSSADSSKNIPTGIYVNVNGTRGHYITREIEVNQGHSNTRNYGQGTMRVPGIFNDTQNDNFHGIATPTGWKIVKPTYPSKYEPINSNVTHNRWKPTRYKPINDTFDQSKTPIYTKPNNPNKTIYKPITRPLITTESPSENFDSFTRRTVDRGPRTNSGVELPTVSIDEDYHDYDIMKNGKFDETTNFAEVVEPDVDRYEVEVLEKETWKPRLVFENKTKKSNVDSVIMSINKKNSDVDLIDVRLEPWWEDEPPFPVYYIAPVQPLGYTPKAKEMTPATGQVLRLRGGSSARDGYLEVQGAHPGWGIVCDSRDGWSLNKAHIVCRQLGYTRGAEIAWQGRNEWDDNELSWIASTRVDCRGNETKFQTCKFIHGEKCFIKRDAVGIRCMENRLAYCRDDEVAHEGQCYHLANPESGLNHAEALKYCSTRKSQLIDITTQAENNFLSEWLLQTYPSVNSIMTSGVGFTTSNRTLWLWENSDRAKFQFNKWWPGWLNERKIPPWPGSRFVCIVMKKQFPCQDKPDENCTTDYFFWDIEDCGTSMKGHSFICERPYDDISCVYGKGQLYAGNANISASGKKCLPWNDQTLIHALRVNVLNAEVREKLVTHNYCRNPKPMNETRPWCFTGSYGEREYCDIPPCGEIGTKRSVAGGKCKPKHFECMPGECIPSPWVCDGEEDCTNGIDEKACWSHLGFFKKIQEHRLEGHDVQKWLNTPAKTCARRCKEADFTCRSFSHKSDENVCLLSDTNVGASGALIFDAEFDYYEMNDRSVNCEGMFVCGNRKCVNQTRVCDGKNDCGDRTDENICTREKLDYDIRLSGSNDTHEGRVEVKVFGHWGQVCDHGFEIIHANVVCKELGFDLGAMEVRPGGYYGNMEPPERFMVDQLKCRGNETSLRECDFDGWGVHNCMPEEAVGVVCKSAVNTCQIGDWKCDDSSTCISTAFICDEVDDCPDKSDESPIYCDAPFELRLANGSSPLEGRVEVRHHGVWGTVCDDDFSHSIAKVICKSLGYGGSAVAKKNGFYGPGDGPIWLDRVFCHGNESQLYKCEHNDWGDHNCVHDEDAGVICTEGSIDDSELETDNERIPEVNIEDFLPSDCGRRPEDFANGEDAIFQRIVRSSIAPKGSYPWQASIRVRGHSRSSHWCGAVILSPLHVLTAAHCLEGYNKGTYFIRAGDYNSEIDEGTEVESNIEDYYVHEDFRKGQRMNNDIALVLLKGRGIALGEHVMPICLPPKNVEYSPGLNCTISGFGSIETGQSAQSLNLRYGWIPLLDQSVCRADYIYGDGNISDGMICAGFLDEGVDACDGDSGGPLACQRNGAFTLYGVTSWGHHCGEANKPGVYVRVAHYRDWIDKKIRESLFGR